MSGADWTCDRQGRTNSSAEFLRAADLVERLIRSSAHSLISGDAGSVARLIVAQMAHVLGMAPTSAESDAAEGEKHE